MKKALLAGITTVLVLVVLTNLAFAASVATPFKGTLAGSETHVFDFPNHRFFVTGQATGTATHLGLYTLSYSGEVFLPTSHSTNLKQTFVAANGDMLFAAGEGQGHVSGNFTTVEEMFTITGGTGRFAGATGSYTVHRTVNRTTLDTWGDFDGSIMTANGK